MLNKAAQHQVARVASQLRFLAGLKPTSAPPGLTIYYERELIINHLNTFFHCSANDYQWKESLAEVERIGDELERIINREGHETRSEGENSARWHVCEIGK